MTEPLFIAIDLGTSGMKAALISASGHVLGWESEPLPLHLTADGGVEQHPDDWWQALLLTTRRLLARSLSPGATVLAICCSTQGEGTLPVDRQGDPLMDCILWMDMRGAEALRRQFGGWPGLNGLSLRRVLRWVRLTGGMPSPTGKDPAAHMLLVRDRFPEVYEKTYKFLNVLDFLNLKLTGRFCCTVDSILTSWVTDQRDLAAVRYDPGLLRDCGIDPDKLPEILPCTEVIGPLRQEVAQELGLPAGVQVVAGAIDNTAAAIGAGAVEDYALHLYIGTSSWMAAHVPYKRTDVFASLASLPCAIPGRYLLTALQATAGGNLTFLRDNILYHKDELLQEAAVPDIFKVLDQMAARVPAGSNGVLYAPWIWGERSPVEDRSLRAGLYNISLHNSREDILRAFLEGIAFNTRWLLAPVEKFLGRRTPAINIVGGGAQSDLWCQIFADVLDREIRQVRDPLCANARGAAWIAAVGLRQLAFTDLPGLTLIKKTFAPQPENRVIYDDRFEIFRQIYSRMRPIHHRLNP